MERPAATANKAAWIEYADELERGVGAGVAARDRIVALEAELAARVDGTLVAQLKRRIAQLTRGG